MKSNFRIQLLISFLVVVLSSTLIVSTVIVSRAGKDMTELALSDARNITDSVYAMVNIKYNDLSQKLIGDLNVAVAQLEEYGDITINKNEMIKVGGYTVPSLYAGDKNLTMDTAFVDGIQSLVGATSTVFYLQDDEFIRVSTNVMKDGERAVGTSINNDSPVYQTIMNKETYYGRAFVVGEWYITGYAPIMDGTGNVVGIVYVGVSERDETLFKTVSDYTIGDNGYVYIMDSKGDVLLHPTLEGQSLIEYEFATDIIADKNGERLYEFNDVVKETVYKYFEEWDWYIISTIDQEDLQSSANTLINSAIIVVTIMLILALALAVVLSRVLTKPIVAVTNVMKIMATGDLREEIEGKYLKRNDEIGQTVKAAKEVGEGLKSLLGEVSLTSQQVAASSEELTATAQQYASSIEDVTHTIVGIADGASNQAENTAIGSGTLNELGRLMDEDKENIIRMNTATEKVSELVKEGLVVVEDLSKKTKANGVAVDMVYESIQKTNESAAEISEASNLIASIANQTNLLALNAAIEAARAGEHGKGFSVVADEIRKLAEQSAQSTKNIDVIIKTLKEDAIVAVDNMEEAKEIINHQEKSVEDTNLKYRAIAEAMIDAERMVELLIEASGIIEGKNTEVQEIMQNLSAVAEENAASTQASSAAMEEQAASIEEITNSSVGLSEYAEELNQLIARFKL